MANGKISKGLKFWFPFNNGDNIANNIGLCQDKNRYNVSISNATIENIKNSHIGKNLFIKNNENPFIISIDETLDYFNENCTINLFYNPPIEDKTGIVFSVFNLFKIMFYSNDSFVITNSNNERISNALSIENNIMFTITKYGNNNFNFYFNGKLWHNILNYNRNCDFNNLLMLNNGYFSDVKICDCLFSDYDIKKLYNERVFEIGKLTTYRGDEKTYEQIADDSAFFTIRKVKTVNDIDCAINDGYISFNPDVLNDDNNAIFYVQNLNYLGNEYTISIWFDFFKVNNDINGGDLYQIRFSNSDGNLTYFDTVTVNLSNEIENKISVIDKLLLKQFEFAKNDINHLILRRNIKGQIQDPPYCVAYGEDFLNNENMENYSELIRWNSGTTGDFIVESAEKSVSLMIGSSDCQFTNTRPSTYNYIKNFNGFIYDFKIFNRYLTDEECENLYNVEKDIYMHYNYLTFISSGETEISFNRYGDSDELKNAVLEYSIDKGLTWSPYQNGSIINLTNNNSVLFKGYNDTLSLIDFDNNINPRNYHGFTIGGTGVVSAIGDVTSLINGRGGDYNLDEKLDCHYCNLFEGCNKLITAPKLPSKKLSNNCYTNMFKSCTSLTEAPELPATQLAEGCYSGMFSYCASLTEAPELPATQLADYCYQSMFKGCTSLSIVPVLNATILYNHCYDSMFAGCSSLTTASNLPAIQLADYCYANMFEKCTSLATAPELPATTLADYCYQSMFESCNNLNIAPKLPSQNLVNGCYNEMFENCVNLSYINASFYYFGDIYTSSWVNGVSETGTFVKNPNLIVHEINFGKNGIPVGWNVIDDSDELV